MTRKDVRKFLAWIHYLESSEFSGVKVYGTFVSKKFGWAYRYVVQFKQGGYCLEREDYFLKDTPSYKRHPKVIHLTDFDTAWPYLRHLHIPRWSPPYVDYGANKSLPIRPYRDQRY